MPGFHFIYQTQVPVRADSSDSSEMVTELLFGDLVEVMQEKAQWRRIRNRYDGYEGWIDEKAIHPVSDQWVNDIQHWEYVHSPYSPVLCKVGEKAFPLKLTFGARIPIHAYQGGQQSIALELGKVRVRIPRMSLRPYNKAEARSVLKISEEYLGAPYLWGGRSIWGLDCSGLTQMVYALHGVELPRDASQQVKHGQEVAFADRQPGDLAFFENDKGRVHHVGIVLEENEIRHAHGNVHDDKLDDTGIYNRITERKTHRLLSVKRFL